MFTIVAAVLAYVVAIRPRIIRWGAADDEIEEALPGDELIADALTQSTRAITIAAPVAEVWPWLVQIGQDRGGFYSYDFLENAMGLDLESANQINPEWQSLAVSDPVRLSPEGGPVMEVALLEPEQALVLKALTPGSTASGAAAEAMSYDFSWAFILRSVNRYTTRLIVRGRGGGEPRGLATGINLLMEPMIFVMEEKMLRGIKERAEGRHVSASEAAQPDEG
jgi:molybdenum-dependent DNA-binding transcriptional regulator ModE